MDAQKLSKFADVMNVTDDSEIREAKNGRFWAFLDVPGKCRSSAGGSVKPAGAEIDRFAGVENAIANCDKVAKSLDKSLKMYAALLRYQLTKQSSKDAIIAFMRLHESVPNKAIQACIMAMLRQYAPSTTANAKALAQAASDGIDGITEWFARDKVFPLLVAVGVIEKKDGAEGFLWADLAAKKRANVDALIGLAKRAAKPAFPELYDEQRKYAATLKANELAKKRAEVARQTAAMVASTDTVEVMRRDSNTKVVIAAVAAALFAGGVLVAKYGSAPAEPIKNAEEEYAPAFDIEQMLRDNHPGFDKLPMSEQASLVSEAEKAFSE